MLGRIEGWFEQFLFGARWLLAPFYLGLILSLLLLLVAFVRAFWTAALSIGTLSVEDAILAMLTLLDLALAANLVLVVILAGYEAFVSKIDTAGHEDRPGWMGTTTFSGLKLKLFASIVAISGIQLLKSFMGIPHRTLDGTQLMWLTAIHLTFVVTAVLSALTDYLSARGSRGSAS
jgi:uncharacterized protein (TIGR00645 family)